MKSNNIANGKQKLLYDKEKTKQKLINAVGKVIVKEGFQNIRINKIERVSGVSKKAIYDYFGGLDGLVTAYLNQVDYWKELKIQKIEDNGADRKAFNEKALFEILKNNLEYFSNSEEMQKIVLWGLSEKNPTIRVLTDQREVLGEKILQEAEESLKEKNIDVRATMAIFISAIYYMVLHSENNGSTMCGIDFSTQNGKDKILDTMQKLLSGPNSP
ncbi:TetR/AcrR family transcriptional regulator [Sphingobacterium sp. SGL-16]|uniref:TetR/AcrR family transcriptional regulator n=1 Tax=Sphingobacterium sp. SGL-16 TaxID=2710883 RepID=UPI0013ECD0F6|nr:TetR/AcrR family transcriptional regulator [Sphingobacterium sp. SGL-16]NGM74859.1 TetR/AcrR family transcriptional regulator [Sphingobacterium sp. SGL-16]